VRDEALGSTPLQNTIRSYELDVTDSAKCDEILAIIHEQMGPIHGLFNCAGINPTSLPLSGTSDAYFDRLINTNLRGPYNMTRAALPFFSATTSVDDTGTASPSIVNVSSTAGIRASAGFAIYNATKFGVIGFSKSMALELASGSPIPLPEGMGAERAGLRPGVRVRVNVVAPGPIDTPTNASVVAGAQAVETMARGVAMGRLGTSAEVADVVTWLFSDGARWVNGAVLEVTGGV
jgi:NAD(P)-dependent dehydrogenase (short-subunit alcohol dehydrogenase family)